MLCARSCAERVLGLLVEVRTHLRGAGDADEARMARDVGDDLVGRERLVADSRIGHEQNDGGARASDARRGGEQRMKLFGPA